MRIFRWKAVTPLALLLGLMVIGWYFLLDSTVRRAIEVVGTELVGAKVDLAAAHRSVDPDSRSLPTFRVPYQIALHERRSYQ